MIVRLESTTKTVELRTADGTVPARIWQGFTDAGVQVHAYITRIACPIEEDRSEFEADLDRHADPRPEIMAIPLRLVL